MLQKQFYNKQRQEQAFLAKQMEQVWPLSLFALLVQKYKY